MPLLFYLVLTALFGLQVIVWWLVFFKTPAGGMSISRRALIVLIPVVVLNGSILWILFRSPSIFALDLWARKWVVFPVSIYFWSILTTGLTLAAWSVVGIIYCLPKRIRTSRAERQAMDHSRREVLSQGARAIFGLSLTVAGYSAYQARTDIEVTRVDIPCGPAHSRLAGLSLVQLSDLHLGSLVGPNDVFHALETALALKPDILVITGDVVNHRPDFIKPCIPFLKELKVPLGAYAVMGNHDFYAGVEEVCRLLADTRVTVLRNRKVTFPGFEEQLEMMGVDDPVFGWAENIRNFGWASGLLQQKRPGVYTILLSHRGKIFDLAVSHGIELTLSGHTHAGQAVLPGNKEWNLSSLALKYTNGIYRQDGRLLYVNRGIGFIVAPVRINCPPEVTRFIFC
ncbi:MAG: metallophosphoesterase [Deltaproteobacteria bacterium]|nr:metallophosphoesterase [Deltaproteobacteria bacterium]